MSTLRSVRRLAAILLCSAAGADAAAAQAQRAFRVDDLFEIEGVGRYYGGPYAFSADERRLAFTRVRAATTLSNHKWEFLWDNAGGDVWVQLEPSASPVNITNGAADGSGWWAPQWSPDGRRLALLSTRGDNVRLWVWEVASGELRELSARGVDLVSTHERPFLWVDGRRILVPLLPEGERPRSMMIELQTPTIALREWPKTQRGEESTASVLQSGVAVDLAGRARSELALVDVDASTVRTLAVGAAGWHLAPDGRHVALTRQTAKHVPGGDAPLAFGAGAGDRAVLEVVALDGSGIVLAGESSHDVLTDSPRWAPDGRRLAFFGYAAGRDEPPLLHVLDVARRTLRTRAFPELDIAPVVREQTQLEWTDGGALLAFAARRTGDGLPDVRARRDWWLIGLEGPPRNLTESLPTAPRQLWPQTGHAAFFGLADGDVWRISPGSSRLENLTAGLDARLSLIAWPAMTNRGADQYRIPGRTYDELVVSAQQPTGARPYHIDLRTGAIRALEPPTATAELMAFGPESGSAIFYSSDRDGLRVWRTDADGGRPVTLIETNTFLRGVAEGELLRIDYTSLNGEPLIGWLILPIGYEPGRRYPLLTWAYAGSTFGANPPLGRATINTTSSLSMQIPAAHGYAVLLPSMPLAPEGVSDDPMLRLPEGVLPAVDRVVELGIADPQRLFLAGQSYGGYSTYGLVTQTRRFAAAVAFAGLSNLISLYGQFDARARYTGEPHENVFMMALLESAQGRMGNPPWKDLGRYIRNSPIFFVDRVETPLLIIYGDMDYVAMQQGEEFFMALYRQGKRAEFVRYWGEGHVLRSPANIRDMWRRVFAWFDEFSPARTDDR